MTRDQFIEMAGMINMQDKINALPQSERESIAKLLHTANTMPGLTEPQRQIEREFIASVVSQRFRRLNIISEAIRNGGNDAVDNFKVSK